MRTAAYIVLLVPDNVFPENIAGLHQPFCKAMGDSKFFMLSSSITYHYPQAAVLSKYVPARFKHHSKRVKISFGCLLSANFMIVIAIVSVAVIGRRSNDCAKLAGWQAPYNLVSITTNYLEGLALQISQ